MGLSRFRFRAWGKKLNRWYPIDGTDSMSIFDEESGLEIMQFTGLHDKNGKEIWEGDVLSWQGADDEYTRGHVFFERGSFWICFTEKPHIAYSETLSDHLEDRRDSEVLGNVYENPELLGEKP